MLRSGNNHVHQLESHQRMNLVSDKVNYGLRQRGANRVGLEKIGKWPGCPRFAPVCVCGVKDCGTSKKSALGKEGRTL